MALASCCGTPALWVRPAANKPTTRVFRQSTQSPILRNPFVGTPLKPQEEGGALHRTREKWHPGRARAGLPVISSVPVLGPLVNTLVSPLVLLAVYAFGVLFMASQKYRSNFKKAVR
eukprot:c11548_g1_i2 orf=240-590(-)